MLSHYAFLVSIWHLTGIWTSEAALHCNENCELLLIEEIEDAVLSLVQISARARRHNVTAKAKNKSSIGKGHVLEEAASMSQISPEALPAKVAAIGMLSAALPADVNGTQETSLFASTGGATLVARIQLAGKVAVGDGEDVFVLFSCFAMVIGLTFLFWIFASLEPKDPMEIARQGLFRQAGHRQNMPWQWPGQRSGLTAAKKTPLLALCTKFLTANSDLPLLVPLDLLREDENGSWLVRILNPKGVARLCAVLRRAASGTRLIEITEPADFRENDPGTFIASISEHLEIRDQHNAYFGRLQRHGHSPQYILDDSTGRHMLVFGPNSNGDVVATLPHDREVLATAARVSSAQRGEIALFTPNPGVDVVLVLLCSLAVSIFESPSTEAIPREPVFGTHADAAAIARRRAENVASQPSLVTSMRTGGAHQTLAQSYRAAQHDSHDPHSSFSGTGTAAGHAGSNPVVLGGVRCPEGHMLREGTKLSWWICNSCQINPPFADRFRCAKCDFDLCKDCYVARQQLLKPRAGGSWQSLPGSTTANTPRDTVPRDLGPSRHF